MKLGYFAIFCALCAVLMVSGCSKPSVVGAWKGSPGKRSDVKITLTLSKDSKFDQTTEAFAFGRQNTILSSGTYTAKDGTLTMVVENVTANGMAMPAPAHTSSSFTYKLEGDSLTITPQNSKQSIVLKRAKE